MDRWTDGLTDEPMDRRTRWIDGQTDLFFFTFFSSDSLMISYQRDRTELERYEIRQLLKLGGATPLHETYIGQRMAQHYISIYGNILDFSSLGEVSSTFEGIKMTDILP